MDMSCIKNESLFPMNSKNTRHDGIMTILNGNIGSQRWKGVADFGWFHSYPQRIVQNLRINFDFDGPYLGEESS